ncbi:hypothetical protein LTR78_001345 [Recurvomyces mirabilis]|uniref:DSBA-like thioredoxin domain-containing protein n=1 Tax=Recurvomyces mirabilis TaxID=574656 RepID=A0AAE0WV93_9PEZI|nr:hypothetical protein LTR78_001345 [Recurvomyces mirabilis]KAK5161322.1 hypothetical protein LTS14_001118 [Recurvomyces mirabilis]
MRNMYRSQRSGSDLNSYAQKIKVYFDTICPWCYIGSRSLAQAIAIYQKTYPGARDDSLEYEFLPFYLNTDTGQHGLTMREAAARKNGAERVEGVLKRLHRTGRQVGIEFDFEGKTGATKMSHALTHGIGREKGWEVQKAVIEEVYRWHFEHGGDICDRAGLIGVARNVGISEGEGEKWIDDEDVGRRVDQLAAQVRDEGIDSVPTMFIGEVRVDGAEDVEGMFQALVAAREAAAITT